MPHNFFPPENPAIYEIMWKNIVQPDRPQMTVRRMRIECCITKATDTHSEYVTGIAFPLQKWSRERTSMSCYTYIASCSSSLTSYPLLSYLSVLCSQSLIKLISKKTALVLT
jgi:hypothetical protein